MPGYPSSAAPSIASRKSSKRTKKALALEICGARTKSATTASHKEPTPSGGSARQRVVIVEEHRLMRDLMRKMLGQCAAVEVVDEAYDLDSALNAIRAANPDVVLIEMRLGKVDALEIIEEVRNGGCRPAFVVVSAQCDEVTAHRIEKAWVHGFVDKRVDTFEALRTALHEIKHGRRYLSPGLVQMRDTRVANPFSFDKILTKRQHEVITSIAKMHSDEKIVKELKISPCTLRGHRRTIALKFNVPVKELAQFAREKGFGS